jgi:DNA modification methylase
MLLEPFDLIQGDSLTVLKTLPERSVDCVVTSPPYWGLRDYGTASWEGGDAACDHRRTSIWTRGNLANAAISDGGNRKQSDRTDNDRSIPFGKVCGKCGATVRKDEQIGLEPTPAEYVAKLVAIFAEVRRVLRDDGTLWVNLGDSYARDAGKGQHKPGDTGKQNYIIGSAGSPPPCELPGKNLIGIPWRVAFALQADGWYLRSDIIWHKPNPMPESVTDRPTKAHEYIFLLSKSARYFYDIDAIREPMLWPEGPNSPDSIQSPHGQGFTRKAAGWHQGTRVEGSAPRDKRSSEGFHDQRSARSSEGFRGGNKRNRDLERYGTTRGKTNVSCSHPKGRNKRSVWTLSTLPTADAHFATFPFELPEICIKAGSREGGIVLDPFAGAGTTGLACLKNGRRFIGIELKPDYVKLAARVAAALLARNFTHTIDKRAEYMSLKEYEARFGIH